MLLVCYVDDDAIVMHVLRPTETGLYTYHASFLRDPSSQIIRELAYSFWAGIDAKEFI